MKIEGKPFEEPLSLEHRVFLRRALAGIAIPPAPTRVVPLTREGREMGKKLLAYFREEGAKEREGKKV